MEVLRRPRIRQYGISEQDVEDLLLLLAPGLPSIEIEVEIRDPDDAPVVAAALAGRVEAIVTGDRDLLDDRDLRQWLARYRVEILTPAQTLRRLGSSP